MSGEGSLGKGVRQRQRERGSLVLVGSQFYTNRASCAWECEEMRLVGMVHTGQGLLWRINVAERMSSSTQDMGQEGRTQRHVGIPLKGRMGKEREGWTQEREEGLSEGTSRHWGALTESQGQRERGKKRVWLATAPEQEGESQALEPQRGAGPESACQPRAMRSRGRWAREPVAWARVTPLARGWLCAGGKELRLRDRDGEPAGWT